MKEYPTNEICSPYIYWATIKLQLNLVLAYQSKRQKHGLKARSFDYSAEIYFNNVFLGQVYVNCRLTSEIKKFVLFVQIIV
jgi:hypothetical protein